ncbi:Nodulation G [Fusarium albosuccineum]|uniref:Nodulation G n=1 Tax=Fusarium albosuccineum TaxID=1237068 RepID=A0A8H4PB99_9HYPO|nr:Nodulation G [Fusarium albosuccineum]
MKLDDSRNREDKADKLAQELGEAYPYQLFVTVQADLSQRDSTRALVPTLLSQDSVSSKHRAVSVLVANAGLGRRSRDVANIEEEDWDEMMEINSRSQFVVTKACLAGMRLQKWGRIILIGSIAARGSGLNGCHYAASKGALSSMGKNLATLLAPEGVTVNIVSPAMIGSIGMIPEPKANWTEACEMEELRATDPGLAIAASVPIHRLGSPGEVCAVISMLARNGYMTGQDILLSGGLK